MQELMCYLGQSSVFEDASRTLKKTLNLEVSSMQIQRISEHHGRSLDPLIKSNCEAVMPKLKPKTENDPTYVMVDGSMVNTRTDEWKEIKLGRVFHGSQVIEIHEKRKEVASSIYVSHLGSVEQFLPKFERTLVPYKNKVIIGDGARWIWKWAEDNYPGATHILDFYHAKEKLVNFAKHHFVDETKRKEWLREQGEILLEGGVHQVIVTLRKCRSRGKKSKYYKSKAIAYYLEHEDRMLYKTYRSKNLLIGSGAIEAAHRSVLQQRLKLSGQRWSISGVNAIANLRCYEKSGNWEIIEKVVKAAAA